MADSISSLCIWIIYVYRSLRPIFGTTVCCTFQVSCSEYAIKAFQSKPFMFAVKTTIQRIYSCNAWS